MWNFNDPFAARCSWLSALRTQLLALRAPSSSFRCGLSVIGWLFAFGIASGAGVPSLEVSSLSVAGLPVSTERCREIFQRYPCEPLTADALLSLGDSASEENRHRQAAGCYRRILKRFPESPQGPAVRLKLGQALLALGETERAIITVEPLTRAAGGPGEAWLLLARAYYRQGEFEESLAKAREFQVRFEQDDLAPRARLVAAWSLWRLGRLERIEEELTPLDSMSRWKPDVQYLRGMTAYALKKWEEAARLLSSAALTAKPASLGAVLYYAGESSRRAGQSARARNCFERLLKELPESDRREEARQALGRLEHSARATAADHLLEEAERLCQEGHYDAAIATYHGLLARFSEHSSGVPTAYRIALWRTGRLHERLGQIPEARKVYERLLKVDPHSPKRGPVLFRMGTIARCQGDLAREESCYRQVYAKFPQTFEALEAAYWLGLRAADNNDSPAARRYADWLLAKLSTEGRESGCPATEPLDTNEGPLERVSESMQEVAAPLPGQSSHERETSGRRQQLLAHALYLQGQLAAREGAWEQARSWVMRLLEVTPEGELRTEALFWLAEAEFRLGHEGVARRRFRELEPEVVGWDEPWVPMVPLRLAQLAAGRQRWTEVLQWTDQLKRDWPEFPLAYEARYLRGRALGGGGKCPRHAKLTGVCSTIPGPPERKRRPWHDG